MADRKIDLPIEITSTFNAEGVKEAQNATRDMDAEQRRSAAATRKEAAADAELEIVMRLVTLGKKALQAEVQKLTQLRKEAAAAGDTEAFRKLTAQLTDTRAELKKVQQAKKLDRLVMFGQAQTAAALAGQMKGLAEQIKSGSTDFAGMTMQVVNMGLAFKALAGPVGLVMAALQLAQMGFDYFLKKREEATKKQTEEATKAAEEAERLGEAFRELGRLGQTVTLNRLNKEVEEAGQAAERSTENAAAAAERRAKAEAEAAETEKLAADTALAVEKARIASAEKLGKLSADEAAAEKQRAEKAHTAALDRLSAEADERAVKEREKNAQIAEDYAAQLEKSIAKLKPIAALKLPTADEYRQLEKRLELLDGEEGSAVYRAQKGELEKMFRTLRDMLRKAEIPFEGTDAELAKFAQDIRETVKAQREAVDAKRREAQADRDAAADARRTADAHAEQRRLANEATAAQRESAEEQRKQSEANKKLTRAVSDLLEATKTTGSYAPEEKRMKTAILAADRKLLEQRRDELTKLLASAVDEETRRSISKTQKEVALQLQGLANAEKANTKEAKKWLSEFKPPELQAKNKQAQRNVDLLNRQLAVQVKNAELAAKNGSPEQYERAKGQISATADRLKRVSGRSAEVDQTLKEINDRLDATLSSSADTAAAEKRSAKAAKDKAAAQEKAADAVKEQKPAETARTADRAAAEMAQQVDALKGALTSFGETQQGLLTAVTDLARSLERLAGSVSGATDAAKSAASAARAAATATARAEASLRSEVSTLWGAVNDIRRGL